MKHSDIFDSFVKIAQQKGLIAEAEPEHTEKDFKKHPRHDSLSIEQIAKLYDNKPLMPEGMEYKHNIMEVAHPHPAIISPAYDNLNGLVESEIERQNISLRIVHKEPDGHLVNRKYAQDKLINNLVRVANMLDNDDQVELCNLADTCLIQTTGLQKKAFPFLIAGIAAALGVLYAKQHMRFHSDGFNADYQKALNEIQDLLTSNTNWGVGYEYTPAFLQLVRKLQDQLNKLNASVQKILPVLSAVETPKTGQELKDIATKPQTQEAHQALEDFKQTVEEVYPFINQVITNFGNENFKQRAVASKGFLSSFVDSTEVLHGGSGLIADDFDDVKHALQTLKIDIDNIVKGLQASENVQRSATQQLTAMQTEESKLFHSTQNDKPAESNKNIINKLLG